MHIQASASGTDHAQHHTNPTTQDTARCCCHSCGVFGAVWLLLFGVLGLQKQSTSHCAVDPAAGLVHS
jgi:hypothetical protein